MSALDILGIVIAVLIIAACIAWPQKVDDWDPAQQAVDEYVKDRVNEFLKGRKP